ncbi:Uncharacterised protein [Chlamydia abortus]|nr:Uncharacterised protein [Chlamydia abortus]
MIGWLPCESVFNFAPSQISMPAEAPCQVGTLESVEYANLRKTSKKRGIVYMVIFLWCGLRN